MRSLPLEEKADRVIPNGPLGVIHIVFEAAYAELSTTRPLLY